VECKYAGRANLHFKALENRKYNIKTGAGCGLSKGGVFTPRKISLEVGEGEKDIDLKS